MSEIYPEGQDNPQEIIELVGQLLDEQSTLWLAPQFVKLLWFILSNLPQTVLKTLIDRNTIIFAPDPTFSGRAMVVPRSMEADGYLLYLSPALVQKRTDESSTALCDEQIQFAIAHELAHVVLGH